MNQATRAIEKAYRQHWGEITSILARKFGSDKLDLIESVVQDAFVKAMEKWPVDGIPENPVA